jgi:hypothetical protein
MTEWLKWTAPVAAILPLACPAYAVEYLTVAQAQKLAFPEATRFVDQLDGHSYKAGIGDKLVGLFVLDHVIGKHLYIDYAVSLDLNGHVHRVDILQYRESYGGEIRSPSWLEQFVGKSSASPLKPGGDIRIISGATLSSTHVTEGVKRILSVYGSRVR